MAYSADPDQLAVNCIGKLYLNILMAYSADPDHLAVNCIGKLCLNILEEIIPYKSSPKFGKGFFRSQLF